VPGYGYTVAPRLELDEAGRPELISLTRLPTDVIAFAWSDSAWVQKWQLGRPTITLWPVQSPPGTHHLVWRGLAPVEDQHLFMAEVLPDGIQEPDTVARVSWYTTEYSGAVGARRRWVAVSDRRKLRVLFCDSAAAWHEAAVEDRPFDITGGVAIAPTGDSSAVVAWAETFRLRWATLEGRRWREAPPFSLGANQK
jgi:hypothetical protein